MTSFTDNAGREWNLAVNVHILRRVRRATGANLMDLANGRAVPPRDAGRLATVLAVVAEDAIAAAGLTPDAFASAIDDGVAARASAALMEALAEFLPAHRRAEFRKALEIPDAGLRLGTLATLAGIYAGRFFRDRN